MAVVAVLTVCGACGGGERGSGGSDDAGCDWPEGPGALSSIHTIDTSGEARGLALGRFGDGDLALAGTIGTDSAPSVIGETELAQGVHFFVARLSPSGALRWVDVAAVMGGSDRDIAGVAVDDDGHVYVAGHFEGSFELGETFSAAADGPDGFVASWTGEGERRWARHIASAGNDEPTGLAARTRGATLTGNVGVDAKIGDTPLAIQGGFVAALDSDGTVGWWQQPQGEGGIVKLHAAAPAPGGGTWVSGSARAPVDFGDGSPRGALAQQWFLARYEADGSVGDAEVYRGETEPAVLAVHHEGGIAVGGRTYGNIDFGTELLEAYGSSRWVASLASLREVRWARALGAESVLSVVIDASGRVGVHGAAGDATDVGADSAERPPFTGGRFITPSAYVASYDEVGTLRWSRWSWDRLHTGDILLAEEVLAWTGGQVNTLFLHGCPSPHVDDSDAVVLFLRW